MRLLVLSSGGCSVWSGVQSGTWLSPPADGLGRVSRNVRYIRCSLRAASALSETAEELEEGGCLLIREPSLQAHSQIIVSYLKLVLLFGLLVFK